jgi:hypothetical protein
MLYAFPNPQSLPAIASLLAQARRAGEIRNHLLPHPSCLLIFAMR